MTYDFWNSNLLGAIVTGLAGLVAYLVFIFGKADAKRNAARILLMEIQDAERLLPQVRESLFAADPRLLENVFLMPSESWSKYRHQFVRDLDRDEWDRIASFYAKCQLYDDSVRYDKTFFQKNEEQIRANFQRMISDTICTYQSGASAPSKVAGRAVLPRSEAEKIQDYQDMYLTLQPDFLLTYSPQKPVNDAKKFINDMPDSLSLTSIGSKLKRLGRKWPWERL